MLSLQTGFHQGFLAARRAFEDPSSAYQQRSWADIANQYDILWAYYSNSIFDQGSNLYTLWNAYKAQYNLYRNIRPLYNPARKLANFYVGQVYPGVLSIDGSKLPKGVPLAIPLADDTPQVLKGAIAQFWQWSNWQAKKSLEVCYGAALGSVMVEVIDDLERRKVLGNIIWPSHIRGLDLDLTGNVKGYVIEHMAMDDDGIFIYRKEVDQNAFRTYRDDKLEQTNENIYGFVPAVWIKHHDTGSDIGSPAIAGTQVKIDNLNNLASHVDDHVHRVIGSPVVLWSTGGVSNISDNVKRGATDEQGERSLEQEKLLWLKGGPDGHVDSLAGNLNIADAITLMDQRIAQIESTHPELTFYEKLREMSQVTGPAAERLMGDVARLVLDAAAQYDVQNIKLFQMAAAIGGMRANSGAWGSLDRQQQKFLPFNLDSYTQGDLDFEIVPRPLFTETQYEQALEKQARYQGVQAAVNAGIPLEVVLRDEGWTEEQLASLGQAQVDKIKRDQMLAAQDVIPTVGQ